jgi:transcriptional regulator with XRE-family HTH domain
VTKESIGALAAYLKAKRQGAHLSVRELARLARVDHGYIVRLESGEKSRPSIEILLRIAGVLEADPTEVLALVGVKPSEVLPSMTVVLRSKYNLSEAEAQEAARLIEERYGRKEVKDSEQTT